MIAWAVRRSSRLGGCTHSCWNNELVVLQRIVRGDARCAEKNAVRMAEGFADDRVLLPPSNKQTEKYDGGKHGATHQLRQPFQLGERRFTIQPRHDWSKLLSQSPEDSSLAEDVERSYRQCSSRSRRTRSQYDPAPGWLPTNHCCQGLSCWLVDQPTNQRPPYIINQPTKSEVVGWLVG
jgi:hypothetical protein